MSASWSNSSSSRKAAADHRLCIIRLVPLWAIPLQQLQVRPQVAAAAISAPPSPLRLARPSLPPRKGAPRHPRVRRCNAWWPAPPSRTRFSWSCLRLCKGGTIALRHHRATCAYHLRMQPTRAHRHCHFQLRKGSNSPLAFPLPLLARRSPNDLCRPQALKCLRRVVRTCSSLCIGPMAWSPERHRRRRPAWRPRRPRRRRRLGRVALEEEEQRGHSDAHCRRC
jgi:hypothetical protein